MPASTLAVGRQLGMYLALLQANDTENVQKEMLFSFESETCYVLHTSSCLSHKSYQGLL